MAETLPLFPLSTVLLPGTSLPLHIFEPRYRQLTIDLVTGTVPGRAFGIIALRQGHSEEGPVAAAQTPQRSAPHTARHPAQHTARHPPPLTYPVGCSAVLREARRLPDGRYDIVVRGDQRFQLLDVADTAAPYLVGTVEWVPDDEPGEEQRMLLPVLARTAREAHRQYCAAAWQHGDWDEPAEHASPASVAHLLASDCMLTLEDRQALLEERCPAQRLRLVRQLLIRETVFVRTLRAVPVPLNQFAVRSTHN